MSCCNNCSAQAARDRGVCGPPVSPCQDGARVRRRAKAIRPTAGVGTHDMLPLLIWRSTPRLAGEMGAGNSMKKRKKVCDSLLRKGFESNLVYEKVKELENKD